MPNDNKRGCRITKYYVVQHNPTFLKCQNCFTLDFLFSVDKKNNVTYKYHFLNCKLTVLNKNL